MSTFSPHQQLRMSLVQAALHTWGNKFDPDEIMAAAHHLEHYIIQGVACGLTEVEPPEGETLQ